jgi:hypothetical protein
MIHPSSLILNQDWRGHPELDFIRIRYHFLLLSASQNRRKTLAHPVIVSTLRVRGDLPEGVVTRLFEEAVAISWNSQGSLRCARDDPSSWSIF